MPKTVIAQGKEFTFDDNVTVEQIGVAIDEYFKGKVEPQAQATPTPTPQPQVTPTSAWQAAKPKTPLPTAQPQSSTTPLPTAGGLAGIVSPMPAQKPLTTDIPKVQAQKQYEEKVQLESGKPQVTPDLSQGLYTQALVDPNRKYEGGKQLVFNKINTDLSTISKQIKDAEWELEQDENDGKFGMIPQAYRTGEPYKQRVAQIDNLRNEQVRLLNALELNKEQIDAEAGGIAINLGYDAYKQYKQLQFPSKVIEQEDSRFTQSKNIDNEAFFVNSYLKDIQKQKSNIESNIEQTFGVPKGYVQQSLTDLNASVKSINALNPQLQAYNAEIEASNQIADPIARTARQDAIKAKYSKFINEYNTAYQKYDELNTQLQPIISSPEYQAYQKANENLYQGAIKMQQVEQQFNELNKDKIKSQSEADKQYEDESGFKYIGREILGLTPLSAFMPSNQVSTLAAKVFKGTSGILLNLLDRSVIKSDGTFADTGEMQDAVNYYVDDILNTATPTPTQLQGNAITKYANVNGLRVMIDDNGKPVEVRDNNYRVIDDQKAKQALQLYAQAPDKYKEQTGLNFGAGANQAAQVMAEMTLAIASAGALTPYVGGSTALAGTLSWMPLMYSGYRDEAIKAGLSDDEANNYALGLSAIMGGLSYATGSAQKRIVESLAGKGRGLFGNILTPNIVQAVNTGQMPISDVVKIGGKLIAKNIAEEEFEELVLEPTVENIVRTYTETVTGKDMDVQWLPEQRELAETAAITAIVSSLFGGINVKQEYGAEMGKMFVTALENPQMYQEIMDIKLANGSITEGEYKSQLKNYGQAKDGYDFVKETIPQKKKQEAATAYYMQMMQNRNLADKAITKEQKERYEANAQYFEQKINDIINGKEEEATVQGQRGAEIQGAEATQEAGEGVDTGVEDGEIISKTGRRIKLTQRQQTQNNGSAQEDLTPETILETAEVVTPEAVIEPEKVSETKPVEVVENTDLQPVDQELKELNLEEFEERKDDIILASEPYVEIFEMTDDGTVRLEGAYNKDFGFGSSKSVQLTKKQQIVAKGKLKLLGKKAYDDYIKSIAEDTITKMLEEGNAIKKIKKQVRSNKNQNVELVAEESVTPETTIEEQVPIEVATQVDEVSETSTQPTLQGAEKVSAGLNMLEGLIEPTVTAEQPQEETYSVGGNTYVKRGDEYFIKRGKSKTESPIKKATYERNRPKSAVSEPIQPTVTSPEEQGVEATVQPSVEAVGQVAAEATPAVLDVDITDLEADDKTPKEKKIDAIQKLNLTHVSGLNMRPDQADGTYLSTEKKGNRYAKDGKKSKNAAVKISNPYITNDTGNISLRNRILNNSIQDFTDEDFAMYEKPNGANVTIDDLSDAGIKKLATKTTEFLKSKGYDSIYFPETNTQEGELIVFDRNNVEIQEVATDIVTYKKGGISFVLRKHGEGKEARYTKQSGGKGNPEKPIDATEFYKQKNAAEKRVARAKNAFANRGLKANIRRDIANNFYPQSINDAVLYYIGMGWGLTKETIQKAFKNKEGAEVKAWLKIVGNNPSEAHSDAHRMAEQIASDYPGLANNEAMANDKEVSNAIDDVLNSYTSIESILEDLSAMAGDNNNDIDAIVERFEKQQAEEAQRIYNEEIKKEKEQAELEDKLLKERFEAMTPEEQDELLEFLNNFEYGTEFKQQEPSGAVPELQSSETKDGAQDDGKNQPIGEREREARRKLEEAEKELAEAKKKLADKTKSLREQQGKEAQGSIFEKPLVAGQIFEAEADLREATLQKALQPLKSIVDKANQNLKTAKANVEKARKADNEQGKIDFEEIEVAPSSVDKGQVGEGQKPSPAFNENPAQPTLKGKDKIAKGLDIIANNIGAKKNFAPEQKESIFNAIRIIGEGIFEELGLKGQQLFDAIKQKLKDSGYTQLADDLDFYAEEIVDDLKPEVNIDAEIQNTMDKAVSLFDDIKASSDKKERKALTEERQKLLSQTPKLEFIDKNAKAIFSQLSKNDDLKFIGNCF